MSSQKRLSAQVLSIRDFFIKLWVKYQDLENQRLKGIHELFVELIKNNPIQKGNLQMIMKEQHKFLDPNGLLISNIMGSSEKDFFCLLCKNLGKKADVN